MDLRRRALSHLAEPAAARGHAHLVGPTSCAATVARVSARSHQSGQDATGHGRRLPRKAAVTPRVFHLHLADAELIKERDRAPHQGLGDKLRGCSSPLRRRKCRLPGPLRGNLSSLGVPAPIARA